MSATRPTYELRDVEPDTYDVIAGLLAYEQDDLDDAGTIQLFQYLIKSGLAWTLDAHYGRVANYLINLGVCAR
jgi:hypothetical protein